MSELSEGSKIAVKYLVGCPIEDVVQGLIVATLAFCDGNRSQAAKLLGISTRGLRVRIKAYNARGANIAYPKPRGRPYGSDYDSVR